MLKDWFSGASSQPAAGTSGAQVPDTAAADKAAARQRRLDADPEPAQRELSAEEQATRRDEGLRRKLQAARRYGGSARRGGPPGGGAPAYESFSRGFNRLLMEQCNASEFLHDGLQVGVSRQAHNAQVQTKYTVGNPQNAGFELNLQLHGFSDMTAASYSTQGRYSLMHQRMFRSGAVGVAQFMAQPQAAAMGGPPGTFFGMLQVPGWVPGGCTQLTYLRGQHVQLNHAARVVRGLSVGANLTYDVATHATTMAYAAHFAAADRSSEYLATMNPDSGEWKLAAMKSDWNSDTDMAVVLDCTEKKGHIVPQLHLALRKNLIGGGALSAVLTGFHKLKTVLEIPFGGDRAGLNQVTVAYGLQYDAVQGSAKHGLTLSM